MKTSRVRYSRSAPLLKKKQGGFIQNLILPGLILLGAVVGFMSLMSGNSSTTDGSKEQASISAAAVLSQGVTVKEASQRALADGITSSELAANASSFSTILLGNKYISSIAVPAPPVIASFNGTTALKWEFANTYAVKDAAAADLGTTSPEQIVFVNNLSRDVCVRINNKLFGESITKATNVAIGGAYTAGTDITAPTIGNAAFTSGTAEGCVPSSATTYLYYKVVNVS